MYFCLLLVHFDMFSTFARRLSNFSLSSQQQQLESVFRFQFSPNRNDATFTVKHFSVGEMDDFSDGDFPVLMHHFLMYICKLT